MELSNRSGGEDGRIILEALPPQHRIAADMFYGRKQTPTFCEVRDKHLALGKGPRGKQGIGQFNNALKLFLGLCGDIPIDQYSRESAHKFIGALVQRKVLHTTIERYVAQIAPIFGTGLREFELPGRNIFEKISIPNKDIVGVKRTSFELGKLRAIQVRCREVDDERRWLLSMLSDTGARLAEIAGLRLADIRLTDPVPHIVLEFTDERRLKQNASIRKVPLLGEALWAAQRIMQNAKGSMAFPSYNKSGSTNAASASAALNKWLRDQGLIIGKSEVIHSFRHTMRDRLRDAGVPEQVCDRLGGWAVGSVGEGYGAGYSIAVLRDWMQRAVPIAE